MASLLVLYLLEWFAAALVADHFSLGSATVRRTVYVSGYNIFIASATTQLLVPSTYSSAVHFASSSTYTISSRMMFSALCSCCMTLLFIQLLSHFKI